ncbi:MAG: hypothetical protein EBQ67_01925 [Sphingobacteriia bacterium]|nr:hypothetical protein [Sphingobacteriia bacterium]
MHSQVFQEIVNFRRSNRLFDSNTPVPNEVIQRSLERAALSPNSSNMQLWEFHWIKSQDALAQMVPLCLNQNAARTARHQVVFVTRQDLWKSRAAWNLQQVQNSIQGEPNNGQKAGLRYYGKLMPFMYFNDPLGIMHGVRWLLGWVMGAFKPFYRPGARPSSGLLRTNPALWPPRPLCYRSPQRVFILAPWRAWTGCAFGNFWACHEEPKSTWPSPWG